MIISISNSDPSKTKLDALVLVFPSFNFGSASWKGWKKLGPILSKLCSQSDPRRQFSGEEGAVQVFPTLGQIAPSWLALVGVGKSTDVAVHQRSLGKAVRQLHQTHKVRSLGVLSQVSSLSLDSVVHATEQASYHFRTFAPSQKEPSNRLTQLTFFSQPLSRRTLDRANCLSDAVRYARELANQPPNLFDPMTLVAEAQKLARRRKLRCKVWDERQLKREGFGGIIAVGQGSARPPRFIRLDYNGTSSKTAPYIVVGKAITFDTGGISIKPSDKMDEMKFDKCGGIAVLGILDAVAALHLPMNVIGLIASAENMPSSTAYRPGDLIQTLSGKYVEVLNTDAEGRIVLADALSYAQRLNPRSIVDLATLTGACVICFGHECAAVLSNHDFLTNELRTAANETGEKIWPMPLWPEYQEKIKSDIAFVKNTAGREGGTITGACFLNAFMDSKVPWAHLDIAGVAWTSKEEPHRAKGATAYGVRLITKWLETVSNGSK